MVTQVDTDEIAQKGIGKESVPGDFFHCDRQFLSNLLKSILKYPMKDEGTCERQAYHLCQYTFANGGNPMSQKDLEKLVDKVERNRKRRK